MQYVEQVKLPFSAEQCYDLVVDVEHYVDFLPGWQSVRVKNRNNKFMSVEQELGISLLHVRFTSFAVLDRPYHIHITMTGKPFGVVDVLWDFVSNQTSETLVMLRIRTTTDEGLHELFLTQVLEKSTHVLLDHFVERAYDLYLPKHNYVNHI